MIKCLIIEDERPAQIVLETYLADAPGLQHVGTCTSALEAMSLLSAQPVDLIFLDIHLPKLDGLSFLRSLPHAPQVIITSAYANYALEGFELSVVDYLLKPFSFERFVAAIQKVNRPTGTQPTVAGAVVEPSAQGPPAIFVKTGRDYRKVPLQDILYLKAERDFVKIFTKEQYYMELQNLKYYEQRLPDNFLRIHKSYVANLDPILGLVGNQMQYESGLIPIGRSYRPAVLKKLGLS
ncbi:MAG TPA: DNA-binding response regulator [Cytophagales bacterium]|nr:DNA-binding response regulator [Cytophagales bacterium]HAA23045.1 DNA-binding response regulator [Cytophagales bacterium]HAP60065.1 DNA-binding response regulator [Cytophagales bacterium]